MIKSIQAKDITDAQILAAQAAVRGRHGVPHWATTWDIQEHLAAFPPKVVLAKLRSMKRRGIMVGCACGCRGDWEMPGDDPVEQRALFLARSSPPGVDLDHGPRPKRSPGEHA